MTFTITNSAGETVQMSESGLIQENIIFIPHEFKDTQVGDIVTWPTFAGELTVERIK